MKNNTKEKEKENNIMRTIKRRVKVKNKKNTNSPNTTIFVGNTLETSTNWDTNEMVANPEAAIIYLKEIQKERKLRKEAEKKTKKAIKEREWIGNVREATAMNTASQRSKEAKKARKKMSDIYTWGTKKVFATRRNEDYGINKEWLDGLRNIIYDLAKKKK